MISLFRFPLIVSRVYFAGSFKAEIRRNFSVTTSEGKYSLKVVTMWVTYVCGNMELKKTDS